MMYAPRVLDPVLARFERVKGRVSPGSRGEFSVGTLVNACETDEFVFGTTEFLGCVVESTECRALDGAVLTQLECEGGNLIYPWRHTIVEAPGVRIAHLRSIRGHQVSRTPLDSPMLVQPGQVYVFESEGELGRYYNVGRVESVMFKEECVAGKRSDWWDRLMQVAESRSRRILFDETFDEVVTPDMAECAKAVLFDGYKFKPEGWGFYDASDDHIVARVEELVAIYPVDPAPGRRGGARS